MIPSLQAHRCSDYYRTKDYITYIDKIKAMMYIKFASIIQANTHKYFNDLLGWSISRFIIIPRKLDYLFIPTSYYQQEAMMCKTFT